MKETTAKKLALPALFAAAIIWGSSFFIMKDTVDDFPVFYLIAVRFLIASILIGACGYKRLKTIDKDTIIAGFVMGLTLFIAYIFQTFGLVGTTPGKNAFLTAAYCVMVPFFEWLFFKNRPDRYNIIAAVACLIGIGFVSLDGDLTIGWGDGLTLICGVFFSLNIIAIAHYTKKHDILMLTALQFGFAGLMSLICAMFFETWPSSVPPSTWAAIAYLAVMVTAVAFSFQNFGIKYEDASRASIVLALESVFGVLFSAIFYGETLSPKVLLGFVIIFVSVITSETKLSFLRGKENISKN